MDDNQFLVPPSPGSSALFSLFTNLYDDQAYSMEADIGIDMTHAHPPMSPGLSSQKLQPNAPAVQQHANDSQRRPLPTSRQQLNTKHRVSKSRFQHTNSPGYICFSATMGELSNAPRRSTFSKQRREEVKRVRQLGACLRCRFRKIPCSGEDPCKACLSTAQAKLGTRALMWMECVRPSFETISIFDKVNRKGKEIRLDELRRDILNQNDAPVIPAPFDMNLESVSRHLLRWIISGTNQSSFSIAGLLRSDKFSHMLSNALGSNVGETFRLMVYLCNDVSARDPKNMYRGYPAMTLHALSHYAGKIVLDTVEARLRPTRLEASQTKLDDLRALFLVTFGVSITARYTFIDTVIRGQHVSSEFKTRLEEFIRLLNHYIVYISGVLNLVEGTSQNILAEKCRFQWDKPGSRVREWTRRHSHDATGRVAETATDTVWNFDEGDTRVINLKIPYYLTTQSELSACAACTILSRTLNINGLCYACQLDLRETDLQFSIGMFEGSSSPLLSCQGDVTEEKPVTEYVREDSFGMRRVLDTNYEVVCYSWGEVPGKFSALSASSDFDKAHRLALCGSNLVISSDSTEESPYESRAAYWTFFNQNRPFEIHSEINQRTFINSSQQKVQEGSLRIQHRPCPEGYVRPFPDLRGTNPCQQTKGALQPWASRRAHRGISNRVGPSGKNSASIECEGSSPRPPLLELEYCVNCLTFTKDLNESDICRSCEHSTNLSNNHRLIDPSPPWGDDCSTLLNGVGSEHVDQIYHSSRCGNPSYKGPKIEFQQQSPWMLAQH